MRRLISLIIWLILFTSALVAYLGFKRNEIPAFGRDYAVIRIFDTDGIDNNEISAIRYTAEDSSEADTEDKGRLWCDAYSYFEELYVSGPEEKGISCKAVVTGGDFFLFHDLGFREGWYYSDTDLHSDRVVIDEKLAFELFGSNDVVDMPLTVGSMTVYVSGVASYDDSEAKTQQFGDAPIIWIPLSIGETLFGERVADSYEIMMQNPVDSYAYNALASVTEGKEMVDVTNRYDLKKSFELLKSFPTRSYRNTMIKYPYWENADRGREDILALLLAVTAITLVGFVLDFALFISERKKR